MGKPICEQNIELLNTINQLTQDGAPSTSDSIYLNVQLVTDKRDLHHRLGDLIRRNFVIREDGNYRLTLKGEHTIKAKEPEDQDIEETMVYPENPRDVFYQAIHAATETFIKTATSKKLSVDEQAQVAALIQFAERMSVAAEIDHTKAITLIKSWADK